MSQLIDNVQLYTATQICNCEDEFLDLNRTELAMIALCQHSHWVSMIHGGVHKKLRSHSYAFAAAPGPAATLLPRNIADLECFNVSIVGALTDSQKAATATKYAVRGAKLRAVLHFLHEHNSLYRNINIRVPNEKTN